MPIKNDSQRQTRSDDDPLGLKNGEANRKRLVAKSVSDAEAKKKSESLLMKMAKFGISSVTGNIIAQQAATAIVAATSGPAAAQGARTAGAAALALDYMPGGEYAKIATGQKLGKVDTLALLGQHGGREIARGEEKPLEQKKKTPATAPKKRQGSAATEIPQEQLRRGWAANRNNLAQHKDNEKGTRLETDKSDDAAPKIERDNKQDAESSQKSDKPAGTSKPGTHLESQPLTSERLRHLHEMQERERESGIKPY